MMRSTKIPTKQLPTKTWRWNEDLWSLIGILRARELFAPLHNQIGLELNWIGSIKKSRRINNSTVNRFINHPLNRFFYYFFLFFRPLAEIPSMHHICLSESMQSVNSKYTDSKFNSSLIENWLINFEIYLFLLSERLDTYLFCTQMMSSLVLILRVVDFRIQ